MGRNSYPLALATALSLALGQAGFCQPGPLEVPPHHGNGNGAGRSQRAVRPEVERWRQMPPDERQRFRSNAERWLQMPAEQRKELRDRELQRRERMQRETEAALRQSGLQLEAERREQYERRYQQERRRIEQDLRQELKEKRERELAPVMERLKKEFGEQPRALSPSPANSPSAPTRQ